jgi:hypothetical protein
MWKPEHRRATKRYDLRYPSDMTDAEWALVEPLRRRGNYREQLHVQRIRGRSFISCENSFN